jgi:hypothetical protein
MKKLITYGFFLVLVLFAACEDIYTPDIEKRENVIVVDARIVAGKNDNYIRLTESLSFIDYKAKYPSVEGADVSVFDNSDNVFSLPEVEPGVFHVNFQLDPESEYKIIINYNGNTYESAYESVPEVPEVDSIYGFEETKIIIEGGENSVGDFRETIGFQLYSDMQSEAPYYRFTARKVLQTIFVEDRGLEIELYHYMWKSYFPTGSFNIATAPEFSNSNSVIKHPLFFLNRRIALEEDTYFAGWIIIIYQHGLSNSAYNYYKDLNNQLNSEGRLFDPLYVQARNNLKCTNNVGQLILGNFEISTQKEYRFYVRFISDAQGYKVKEIDEFYEIPLQGDEIDEYPDFWEH